MKKLINKRISLICFIVCYLAYISVYISRTNLSMASSSLVQENYLDIAEIGWLGSVFSVVYAFGRMLNGKVIDRVQPYRVITTGLLIVGICNIFFSFFVSFPVMLILWGLNAYGQSMLWGAILKAMAATNEVEKAKKRTAYMVSSVAVGNILGIVTGAFLLESASLKIAFAVPGIINVILSMISWFSLKLIDFKSYDKKTNDISILSVILSKDFLKVSFPVIAHGIIKDNIILWMPMFLLSAYGIDVENSFLYLLIVPTVGLLGRLLYNPLYEFLENRENSVACVSFVICLGASVMLLVDKIYISILCLGIIYAAVSLINTSFLSIYPMRFIKSDAVASVSGIMDFLTYLSAGIGSSVYGGVIKQYGFYAMFVTWIVVCLISVINMQLVCRQEKSRGE